MTSELRGRQRGKKNMRWSTAQVDFLREQMDGKKLGTREFINLFRERFGIELTEGQVRGAKNRFGVKSGKRCANFPVRRDANAQVRMLTTRIRRACALLREPRSHAEEADRIQFEVDQILASGVRGPADDEPGGQGMSSGATAS